MLISSNIPELLNPLHFPLKGAELSNMPQEVSEPAREKLTGLLRLSRGEEGGKGKAKGPRAMFGPILPSQSLLRLTVHGRH